MIDICKNGPPLVTSLARQDLAPPPDITSGGYGRCPPRALDGSGRTPVADKRGSGPAGKRLPGTKRGQNVPGERDFGSSGTKRGQNVPGERWWREGRESGWRKRRDQGGGRVGDRGEESVGMRVAGASGKGGKTARKWAGTGTESARGKEGEFYLNESRILRTFVYYYILP